MTTLEKIDDFLSGRTLPKYVYSTTGDGDIWQKISSMEIFMFCMDYTMDLIDESDYLGLDFSGERRVYQIFFTGDMSYFLGIWIGNDPENEIDQYPVFIFNFESDNIATRCNLNFRQCIEMILNDFLNEYDEDDAYKEIALHLLNDVKVFSNNLIDKGEYPIKYYLKKYIEKENA